MKRKKPPIALISFLVISVLGLVIFSSRFAFYNKSAEEQQAEIQKQAQEAASANAIKPPERKADATADLNKMKDAMKQSASKAPAGVHKQMPVSDTPDSASQPTVVMPPDEVRKPVQNSTSPSSQWYGAGK